jgi:dGTPase
MALFENSFYIDEDCNRVCWSKNGWYYLKPLFDRQWLNRSSAFRTPFQLDLDNLTFCGAFRRLQGKTQVRPVGPECFSRTRLSHSIEIARIAQSVLSKFHLLVNASAGQFIDADLVEFACFAHDIGNPPFGHAGERELNRLMKDHGGFEGNAQSLRIVTETAWIKGGIRPTKAGIESILKYKVLWKPKTMVPEKQHKFLYDYQGELLQFLRIGTELSIECRIMDLADDIGNALIDFTDGVRAKIITKKRVKDWMDGQVGNVSTFAAGDVLKAFLDDDIIMSNFSSVLVQKCVAELQFSKISADTERNSYKISLSRKYQDYIKALQHMNKEFLFTDDRIRASDNKGAFIIRTLFEIFRQHYVEKRSNTLCQNKIIPKDWHNYLQRADDYIKFRIICDYLSGMTDDYAKRAFDLAMEVAL